MKVWINSEEESNMVSGKNCLRQMVKDLQKAIMFNFLFNCLLCCETISGGLDSKEAAYSAEEQVSISGLGRSLEKGMATHSSILAWKIPWTEEPGRVQSMGSQRVGHN